MQALVVVAGCGFYVEVNIAKFVEFQSLSQQTFEYLNKTGVHHKHLSIRRKRSEQPVSAHSNTLWSGVVSSTFSPRGLNFRGLTYIREMMST